MYISNLNTWIQPSGAVLLENYMNIACVTEGCSLEKTSQQFIEQSHIASVFCLRKSLPVGTSVQIRLFKVELPL